MSDELKRQRMELLLDYIMKKCLWQFHSRSWDRERQNENILKITSQLLCDEEIVLDTPEQRCYWADALCMADAFTERFAWLAEMDTRQKKEIMQDLKERLDFLTINGSLNLELKDIHY
ncbi:Fe-only nitrogenase subunit delta [Desulfitobacterium chlororespirans]|uniref:Nitrogenase iron-iron protein delta chain n=1 Tax=Desulfitobacterium chlororespirans DSM 11544 TaxID=1121395 RepID=A0A1M7TRC1_9FIRM|nr:Fe-only nitrogenase subunit delta [Desulfitobacterium chlororespirans]SHN73297.1 nitrogenase delta subunit [Desulfitobacterium chlororespirans DSM 11544]